MSRTVEQKQRLFTELVQSVYGANRTTVTRQEIIVLKQNYGLKTQSWLKDGTWRIGRGVYRLPFTTALPQVVQSAAVPEPEPEEDVESNVIEMPSNDGLVPAKNRTFVPFGAYDDVRSILESRMFFPVYLAGPTRSGKTLIPFQACAELGRHLYRVNVTVQTDELDLLGGRVLTDGNTVWEDGPAIKAAEDPAGGILLLDEIDLGTDKLMCLQPLLEGNPIYLKKPQRWVFPKPGFNIIATGNTKGRGGDDGKYIGTHTMNEALLERFAVTYEQGYPEKKIEVKILKNTMKLYGNGIQCDDFIDHLCQWADNTRKTFQQGGCDEQICTGRLIHIMKAYVIFGRNRLKAIRDSIARFDLNTQSSFLQTYKAIDPNVKDGPDTPGETKLKPW